MGNGSGGEQREERGEGRGEGRRGEGRQRNAWLTKLGLRAFPAYLIHRSQRLDEAPVLPSPMT